MPLTGWLMPEVAAHLQRVFDAHSNPAARTTGTDPEAAGTGPSTGGAEVNALGGDPNTDDTDAAGSNATATTGPATTGATVLDTRTA
ncbi:hypothetical protein BJH93_15810 [Kocuria polaris]|nr:hypothetical protein [Kocuria polaris]